MLTHNKFPVHEGSDLRAWRQMIFVCSTALITLARRGMVCVWTQYRAGDVRRHPAAVADAAFLVRASVHGTVASMSHGRDRAYRRLYEPLSTLKPVAEGVCDAIWIVDGPVVRMSFPLGLQVPFPTRTTVVRLSDGGLWVHSPGALPPSLAREVVFFHRASRTLILTDLIENFEVDTLRWPWSWLMRLSGAMHPDGKAPVDMRKTFRKGREAARASLARMLAWQPERVVISHGTWYQSHGTAELERAFRWLR